MMINMNSKEYSNYAFPQTTVLELTERCNFNCVYCYESHIREDLLQYCNYESILHELELLGCFRIILTGGEPFMRKDLLFSIAKKAKSLNFHVTIITNLSLCDSCDFIKLYEIGVDEIRISVYGYWSKTYEKMCRVAVSAAAIRSKILELQKTGMNIKLQCSLTNQNIDDLRLLDSWCNTHNLSIAYNFVLFGREDELKENLKYAIDDAAVFQLMSMHKIAFY